MELMEHDHICLHKLEPGDKVKLKGIPEILQIKEIEEEHSRKYVVFFYYGRMRISVIKEIFEYKV